MLNQEEFLKQLREALAIEIEGAYPDYCFGASGAEQTHENRNRNSSTPVPRGA